MQCAWISSYRYWVARGYYNQLGVTSYNHDGLRFHNIIQAESLACRRYNKLSCRRFSQFYGQADQLATT